MALQKRLLPGEDVFPEQPSSNESDPPARKARVPFGSTTQKLAYPARPGYHRHWFNDYPGRIDRATEAGYEFVLNDKGEKVSKVVGRHDGGAPIIGYLMEIPQEWYDEDMAAEAQLVNDREETIRRGKMQGPVARDDSGRYYDTAQGRSISIKRG